MSSVGGVKEMREARCGIMIWKYRTEARERAWRIWGREWRIVDSIRRDPPLNSHGWITPSSITL